MTIAGDGATKRLTPTAQLRSLSPAQVLSIDRALTALGPFGEVRIVKSKGRVRFIETLESRDLPRAGDGRGDD